MPSECVMGDFISSNSLMIVGIFLGSLTGCCMCVLKSRCSKIKCCCVSCERNVLSEQAINNLQSNIQPSWTAV